MKLLKNILDKQPDSPDAVLSWLYWLEAYCFVRDCGRCLYWKLDCEVHQVYRNAFPNSVYIIPACWNLPISSIKKTQPPNLDFIARVKWSEDGFPNIRGEENETY